MKMRRIVAGCVLHRMRRRIDEKNRMLQEGNLEVAVHHLVKGSCCPDLMKERPTF